MTRYRVNSGQTSVDVDLKVNLHPSHIRAHGLSGVLAVELDEQGRPQLDRPYSAELSVAVENIKSGNGVQDREMRRRFDAKRHPSITARLKSAKELGGDRYGASVELSMHGQSKVIEGEATLQVEDGRLTIDGAHAINMKDFGIDPPRLLVLKVEPELNVRVHLVAEQHTA